ncbi:MAG: hypothetical protein FJ109_12970 [Deltaproteobacteria bacterium]|nr:hypothetical protein [Deltaproteobacteria bacterium]
MKGMCVLIVLLVGLATGCDSGGGDDEPKFEVYKVTCAAACSVDGAVQELPVPFPNMCLSVESDPQEAAEGFSAGCLEGLVEDGCDADSSACACIVEPIEGDCSKEGPMK